MTETITTDAILEAFATTQGRLPRAAVEQAIARWPEVSPALLALMNEAAAERPGPTAPTTSCPSASTSLRNCGTPARTAPSAPSSPMATEPTIFSVTA
jgi:hypothetical protein